jgi:hypothetical protein
LLTDPCDTCAALIWQLQFKRMVVGDISNYSGNEDKVRRHGVDVDILEDPEVSPCSQNISRKSPTNIWKTLARHMARIALKPNVRPDGRKLYQVKSEWEPAGSWCRAALKIPPPRRFSHESGTQTTREPQPDRQGRCRAACRTRLRARDRDSRPARTPPRYMRSMGSSLLRH